jgi:RNA polymerase sigma-70 factor, ECF subfamily
MDTTPRSLLDRLCDAPEQAVWEQFVDMYTPLFFTWAKRLGLREYDAADLVQDLFIILVEKLPEFHYDASKSFRGWLKTILLNRWRNLQRKRATEPAASGATALYSLPAAEHIPELEES